MSSLLNKFITKWKGSAYKLDKNIPLNYLIVVSFQRVLMLLRGKLSGIKNKGLFFFSWNATVKCRSRITIGKLVTISRGVFIDALSTQGINLGNNVSLGVNTKIIGTGNLQLLGVGMRAGNNVGLGTGCFYGCGGGIEIGDDTIIGDFVSFHAENHNFSDPHIPIRLQGVSRRGIKIGNNCWIGAKSTILDGAIIEDGCIIAAGTVVTAGIYHGDGIYGGVPGKLIKNRTVTDQWIKNN
jgi:acetyltransferase-like isoleucine patch superfamily enzyme